MTAVASKPAARQVLPARKFPTRTCVACRTERQKRDFLRVVRTPEGVIMIDDAGRSNGRGAYLCADASCWQLALKKHSIERALGGTLPAEVRERLATSAPQGGLKDGS